MYDTNMFFAFVIGGLIFLAVHDFFFRKDGPWAKRSRYVAIARVRGNQLRQKWNSGNQEESTALRSPAMVILVVILVMMLVTAFIR
jgi:hypothetical protein